MRGEGGDLRGDVGRRLAGGRNECNGESSRRKQKALETESSGNTLVCDFVRVSGDWTLQFACPRCQRGIRL